MGAPPSLAGCPHQQGSGFSGSGLETVVAAWPHLAAQTEPPDHADLAPVRPQMPSVSPAPQRRETPFRAQGPSWEPYRSHTSPSTSSALPRPPSPSSVATALLLLLLLLTGCCASGCPEELARCCSALGPLCGSWRCRAGSTTACRHAEIYRVSEAAALKAAESGAYPHRDTGLSTAGPGHAFGLCGAHTTMQCTGGCLSPAWSLQRRSCRVGKDTAHIHCLHPESHCLDRHSARGRLQRQAWGGMPVYCSTRSTDTISCSVSTLVVNRPPMRSVRGNT